MWVNIGLPAHSPRAQMSGALVSQRLVDCNKAAIVQVYAGLVEPDACGVRNAAGRDQDVAALDGLLAGARSQRYADRVSGLAFPSEKLSPDMNRNAFVGENPPDLL
jgi:hypothetical protein